MLRLRLLVLALGLMALPACQGPGPTGALDSGPVATVASAGPVLVVDGGSGAASMPSPVCPEGRVLVPAGTFQMGSPAEDKDSRADERPVRAVKLHAFCI